MNDSSSCIHTTRTKGNMRLKLQVTNAIHFAGARPTKASHPASQPHCNSHHKAMIQSQKPVIQHHSLIATAAIKQ
jgi:hypothetical protein